MDAKLRYINAIPVGLGRRGRVYMDRRDVFIMDKEQRFNVWSICVLILMLHHELVAFYLFYVLF